MMQLALVLKFLVVQMKRLKKDLVKRSDDLGEEELSTYREAKFKRALRVLILQNTFAAFAHQKLKVAQI